jgi:hypothetical protein
MGKKLVTADSIEVCIGLSDFANLYFPFDCFSLKSCNDFQGYYCQIFVGGYFWMMQMGLMDAQTESSKQEMPAEQPSQADVSIEAESNTKHSTKKV